MNEYEVTGEVVQYDFGAKGVQAVLQNVAFILATIAFSCPLDRDFAWSPDLDAPLPVAQARMTARVMEALRRYESRAEVVQIRFAGDENEGQLKPIVRVRVDETAI